MNFLGEFIAEVDGIGKQLRYKKDEKDTAKHRCSRYDEVEEEGNLGFIVLNSCAIGCEQIQLFNRCSRDKTKQCMTEFVHDGAVHEESIDCFRIDILCPQPARCITEEDNHDKTDC